MKYRMLNKIYAQLNRYFWLPCPVCGQMFGGHEWKDIEGKISTIPDPTAITVSNTGRDMRVELGKAICPDCTKSGKGKRS